MEARHHSAVTGRYSQRCAGAAGHAGAGDGRKIFFIDGTGAWGNPTPQNVAYGAAKRAITQVKASASLPIFVHRCERRKSLSVCFNACPLQLSCLQLS